MDPSSLMQVYLKGELALLSLRPEYLERMEKLLWVLNMP
jgi:hypothetical protein